MRWLIAAVLALLVGWGARYVIDGYRLPPDRVRTIKTAQPDLHLTLEHWDQGWRAGSSRLVAHLVRDGIEDRRVVAQGTLFYFVMRRITWPHQDEMVVCMDYLDMVSDWQPVVILKAGSVSKTLQVELRAEERENDWKSFLGAKENGCPIVAQH